MKMISRRIRPLLKKPALFVAAFALAGVTVLLVSRAAAPFANLEIGAGSAVTAPATIITGDSTASANSYVRFGPGSVTPTGKPGLENTGVPAGTPVVVHNGDMVITSDNSVIDAKDVRGFVIVRANNVTIRRSIIRGGIASGNRAIIQHENGCGLLIEDSEVTAANPAATVDNIWTGCDFTARRLNVNGGVDGIKAGSDSRIEASYIHSLSYFSSDPNQNGGPTHNDAIQILSGTNIMVSGNHMPASGNAAIQITQDFGTVSNVTLTGNWADGGGCTFNIAHKGGPVPLRVTVTNNRFGRNSFFNCPILISTQTVLTASGNVYEDNNQPVPVQQHD